MGNENMVYDVELVGIVFLRTVTRPGTPYSPLLSNSQLFWGVRVFNYDVRWVSEDSKFMT